MKKLSKTELKKINAGADPTDTRTPLGDCMVNCGFPGPNNPDHDACVWDCMNWHTHPQE